MNYLQEKLIILIGAVKYIKPKSSRFDEVREELHKIKGQNNFSNLEETIWNILNDFPQRNICKKCNNDVQFIKSSFSYSDFCSRSCQTKHQLSSWTPEKRKLFATNGQKGLQAKLNLLSKKDLMSYFSKQRTAREQTFKEKYGENVTNPMHIDEVKKLNHQSLRDSGYWIPIEQYNDYQLYCRQVAIITNKQNYKNIDNFHLRGNYNKENPYHLDHMFSKSAGFKLNIPPYIIGNIVNLNMIPLKENCSKREICSIGLEELFELFFKENLAISFVL